MCKYCREGEAAIVRSCTPSEERIANQPKEEIRPGVVIGSFSSEKDLYDQIHDSSFVEESIEADTVEINHCPCCVATSSLPQGIIFLDRDVESFVDQLLSGYPYSDAPRAEKAIVNPEPIPIEMDRVNRKPPPAPDYQFGKPKNKKTKKPPDVPDPPLRDPKVSVHGSVTQDFLDVWNKLRPTCGAIGLAIVTMTIGVIIGMVLS